MPMADDRLVPPSEMPANRRIQPRHYRPCRLVSRPRYVPVYPVAQLRLLCIRALKGGRQFMSGCKIILEMTRARKILELV